MVELLIGADICPIGMNLPYFLRGDARGLFNDLLEEFERADLGIVNLECPLINRADPIEKSGPAFGGDGKCVEAIKAAHIDVVSIANNHIMDHGPRGLENTIRVCDEAGIAHVGAGENLEAAGRILVVPVKDVRVGMLSYVEHEFSVAGRDSWGANPLDPIEFVRSVRRHRDDFDFLVVFVHGGNEVYPYPRPGLMNLCRFMAEEGADAVICQHSHCAGCHEVYQGSQIVYGQGNLLLDEPPERVSEHWTKGSLLRLRVAEDRTSQLEFIPLFQSDGRPGARKMGRADAEEFLGQIEERSRAIAEPGFVERRFRQYCEDNRSEYLSRIRGHGRFLRALNRRFHLIRLLPVKKLRTVVRNVITCESHREVLETILE